LNATQTKVASCCDAIMPSFIICNLTFAATGCICCLAACALGALYWLSYGIGVAFDEIIFSHQYFGDNGDSAFARYFATPGIGFAVLIAPFTLCGVLCLGPLIVTLIRGETL